MSERRLRGNKDNKNTKKMEKTDALERVGEELDDPADFLAGEGPDDIIKPKSRDMNRTHRSIGLQARISIQ